MNISVSAMPVFHIPLSLQEAKIISGLSQAHYDRVCRSASAVGGFVFGWINMLTFAEEQNEPAPAVKADWREVDTVLKICEIFSGLDDEEKVIADKIYNSLTQLLKKTNELLPAWTAEIEVG